MAPKVQPRRKQPARSGSSATLEDESKQTSSELSAKEPFVDDPSKTQEVDMETRSAELQDLQPSDPPSGQGSTPAATAGSLPARRPVQRLKSVLAGSSSNPRSNTDGEPRPAALKFKPKSFIRRSKEEREAVEKAEAERRAARQAAEGGASTSDRGGYYGRGRGRGGGFADMNKWKNERFGLSGGASGHLGGSTIKENPIGKRGRGGASSGRAGRSDNIGSSDSVRTSSTRAGTRVKRELVVKPERDRDGDILMTSSASTNKRKRAKIKNEDEAPTYVSSEGEFDSEGAERVDIEQINLVTDDEDTDNDLLQPSDVAKGKQRQRAPQLRHDPLRPVRIRRQEHVERAVGVNTDASSLTSAELRRKAKERNEAEGSLFLPDEDEKDTSHRPKMKGRRKPRDVEFVRDERKWKGVYQEEDDKHDDVKVKEERKDDDEVMAADMPLHKDALEVMDVDEEAVPLNQAIEGTLPSLSETARTVAEAEQSSQTLQGENLERSDGERARAGRHEQLGDRRQSKDWNEEYEDLITEIEELYALLEDFEHKPTTATKAHDDEEINSLDEEADIFSSAENPSFIFQLPPLVPSLRDKAKKLASQEKKPKARPTPSEAPKPANPFATTPIKEDPDIKPDSDTLASQTANPNTYMAGGLNHPGGRTGALTIHKGGKMSAEWGGQGMEVNKEGCGGALAMPQEMVMTKYVREIVKREDDGAWEERVEVGEKGWSMGTVKPGCVCVPEIGELFS